MAFRSKDPESIGSILSRAMQEMARGRYIQHQAARVRNRIEKDCDGDEALAQEREEKGGPIWG